ncbi:hypothetical protein JDV02_002614 [Purpureocillium takamizusanense]|uniref:A-kinase anchor protein 7-like phosphoesterase domain-containing protein n=1 Tax=Purpureocillium takamizusanense TaxID=2060973 RepID=A0A9Q8Q9Q9_9HYPO|nr:uncharacterized protein JDV02_002614 [Purpureocillium takamizusanense]UNI16148.1 hypothetical protein JDV02_002614 [Purpureocillium takamizusanense]
MPPKAATSPTHFLCIPLASPQLARAWASFRADVTSPHSFALPEDAVRPLGTLHLTLGVMSLGQQDGGGVDRAAEVLAGLRPRELLAELRRASNENTTKAKTAAAAAAAAGGTTGEGISITLRGLRAMHAPSKTSVLYAPPTDEEGLLQRFCEGLRAPFREAGLMKEEEGRPMLLHATLINTIYVKGGSRGRGRERMMLDARDVLARYGGDDYVWAEGLAVTRIAVCRMGAKPVEGSEGDQAYEVEAEVEV